MKDSTKSAAGADVRLISCLGIDLELPLLPHFFTHYTKIGIDPANMHLILNTADAANPDLAEAERILDGFGAAPPVRWIAPYTSDTMWETRRALQRDVARPGDWIVNADMDEHHVYPAAISGIVRHCHAKGHNAVQGVFWWTG